MSTYNIGQCFQNVSVRMNWIYIILFGDYLVTLNKLLSSNANISLSSCYLQLIAWQQQAISWNIFDKSALRSYDMSCTEGEFQQKCLRHPSLIFPRGQNKHWYMGISMYWWPNTKTHESVVCHKIFDVWQDMGLWYNHYFKQQAFLTSF